MTDSLFVPGGAGPLPAAAASSVAARSAPAGVTEITLAVATEQYLAGLLQKPRSLKTEDRYRSEIRHIVAFFGSSTPVWTINESECDRFRYAFGLLPPNFENHIRRGASIADIVAKRAPADRTLAWATHHKYLSQLTRFLRWAHKRDYLAKSYGDDLKPLGAKPQASVAKLPFEDKELARPIYTGCRDDGRGFARPGNAVIRRARYWAPLIALYSGLRCGEILQLTTDHFRVSPAGNDFIVLTPDMTLKNGNAEREIPVHTMLQHIGLIDWVKVNAEAVFAELIASGGLTETPADGHFPRRLIRRLVAEGLLDGQSLLRRMRPGQARRYRLVQPYLGIATAIQSALGPCLVSNA